MKRTICCALTALGATLAFAQAEPGGKGESQTIKVPQIASRTTDPEEFEIETAMAHRMVEQQDGWFHDGDFPAIISALRYQADAWPFDEESNSNLGWMLGNIERKDEEIATYMKFALTNPDNSNSPYSAATLVRGRSQAASNSSLRDIQRMFPPAGRS